MRELEWSDYTKQTKRFIIKIGMYCFLVSIFMIIIFLIPVGILAYKDKLLSIFAVIGIVVSLIVAETNKYYQRKQLQVTIISKVFELLSDPEVRKVRRELHQRYNELKGNENEIIFEKISPDYADKADLVLSSFDQVSALVLNRLLDKELIFDIYGAMIVREWQTLRGDINLRQNKNKKSVRHFTELKNMFESLIDENDKKPY